MGGSFLLATALFLCVAILSSRASTPENYARLLDDLLFKGYYKLVPPVSSQNDPVNVTVGLSLTNIADVNSDTGEVRMSAWPSFRWHSPSLSWDPSDYDGIQTVSAAASNLWVPDITIYNQVGKLENEAPDLALIYHDGSVYWVPKWTIVVPCHLSRAKNVCNLRLSSWTMHGGLLDLSTNQPGIDTHDYSEVSRFTLVSVDVKRNVLYYPCCPESYVHLSYTIEFADKNSLGSKYGNYLKNIFWS